MVDTNNPVTREDWIACLLLPKYLAVIPAGKLMPLGSPVIWVDGNDVQMTSTEYMKRHGVDPAMLWEAKKAYNAANGKGVRVG